MNLSPGSRSEGAIRLLKESNSVPAIIYAPTRKIAEQIHTDLTHHFSTGLYHAGLPQEDRTHVQQPSCEMKLT